jgi:hypothetical protein
MILGPRKAKMAPQKEEKLRHSFCLEFDVFSGGLEASPKALKSSLTPN